MSARWDDRRTGGCVADIAVIGLVCCGIVFAAAVIVLAVA